MPIKMKSPKNWFSERISRFKPVVFLKQNLPFFLFILILAISFIAGFWNIRKYNIHDIDGMELEGKPFTLVNEYLEKNIEGKNFFSVYSKDLEQDITKKISYVKSARVGKIAPNKLEISLEIERAKVLFLDKENKCNILSDNGIVLEQLCTETEDVPLCCTNYASDGRYYIFKSEEAEISDVKNGKEQLLVMNNIVNIVKIVESFGYKVKEINQNENVLHIIDVDGRNHFFTLADDIETQLARYSVVMGKVKGDEMPFNSIDVRFEKPVLKN